MPVNAQILKNKAIICEEINNDFKSMYGFKFIDEDSVQILIKNSDTVDVLVDNILKYQKMFLMTRASPTIRSIHMVNLLG